MNNYTKQYLPNGQQVQTQTYGDSLNVLEQFNPSRGAWKQEPISYKAEMQTDKYHIIREKDNIGLVVVANCTSPRDFCEPADKPRNSLTNSAKHKNRDHKLLVS